MENASKALLIAGGMLIAIITISLVVIMFNKMSGFYSENQSATTEEQIVKINMEYEAYNRDDVTGIELVTLLNKIKDYNKKYNEEGYNIDTNIETIITNYGEVDSEFKAKTFKCTSITYNSKTGRINGIYFQ